MRTVLITAVSAAVSAFVAAGPAFAQETRQPGIGNDYPAYYGYYYGPGYYWPGGPFAPVGAAAALGAGVVGAAGALASGVVNTATYPLWHHCLVYRDAAGRRICGP